jgi:GNAT superfamily N-acetyltransferase
MIRPATENDLRRIVEMSEKFYPFTSYWIYSKIPFSPVGAAVVAQALIENGVMNVVEIDGSVVGMIGLIFIPFIFNNEYTHSGEIIWWVEPEYQSGGWGRKLLRSIEPQCKEAGAVHIQMMDLANSPLSAAHLFEAEGYVLTERIYTKVV